MIEDKVLFNKVLNTKRIKRKKLRRFMFPKKEVIKKIEIKKHFTLTPKDQNEILENLLVKNIP